MSLWAYEARDSSGKVVRGTHNAPDRRAALETLRGQGLFLTRLEETRGGAAVAPASAAPPATPSSVAHRPTAAPPVEPRPGIRPATEAPPSSRPVVPSVSGKPSIPRPAPRPLMTGGDPAQQNPRLASAPLVSQPLLRASSKDLSQFFRQLGSMVHAGTTIGAALHSMASHGPNAALRSAATQMEMRTMSGEPLSDSMRAFPGLFSPLQVGMVSAGERGGFLDQMFARLSRYCERDYDLQQTIKRETWYPKLLVFASILIPSAVPLVLAVVQKNGQNPLLAWLASVGPPLIVIGLAVAAYRAINYAAPLAQHQSSLKLWVDGVKLRFPVAGKVVRGLATAKFCRALGALYGAGVGPGESVRLAADACGNAAIAQSSLRIIPRLEHGETLTDCLDSTGHFPSSVIQVMHVGETSGSLDEQLDKSADFLETDAEVAVKQSVQVLGIVVFLMIAIYIGVQVGSFYLGYFNSMFDEAEKAAG